MSKSDMVRVVREYGWPVEEWPPEDFDLLCQMLVEKFPDSMPTGDDVVSLVAYLTLWN